MFSFWTTLTLQASHLRMFQTRQSCMIRGEMTMMILHLLRVLHALLEAGARAGEPRLRLRLQFQELAVFGVELAGTVFVLVSCCLFESGQLGGGRLTSAPASPDSDLAGSGRSCRRSGPGYTR